VEAFVEAWEARHGLPSEVKMAQGIYVALGYYRVCDSLEFRFTPA
jgi:hypothetical protein